MTDVKSEKKVKDPLSEAKNWEDRVRKEMQAPHKWSEDWGTLFHGEVPHEYDDRVKHLEEVLKTKPQGQILPRYGLGAAFREPPSADFRRKKLYEEDPLKFEDA